MIDHVRSVHSQRLLHRPGLAEADIPEDEATDGDGDAEESEVPEEGHENNMEDKKVWFIEKELGKLLERFPQPCKVCVGLENKNPDLSDHVNPWHMFSPGITCKLCDHVSQIDES